MEDVTSLVSPLSSSSWGFPSLPLLCDVSERKAVDQSAGARSPGAPSEAEAAILLSVAEGHLCDEQPLEAEKAASEALGRFRQLGDHGAAADAVRILVAAHWLKDEADKALQMARDELQSFREAGNQRAEAVMTLALAELLSCKCWSRPAYRDALQMATAAAELFRKLEDVQLEGTAALVLAVVHCQRGKADAAMDSAADAVSLFRRAGSKRGEAKGLSLAAVSHALARKYDKALEQSTMARAAWQETGLLRLEAAELRAMAQCHHLLKDRQQMLQTAEESLALCQKAKCRREEAATLMIVVQANVLNGNEDQALFVAHQGLSNSRSTSFSRGQVAALEAFIYLHRKEHDLGKSLSKAEEALEIIRDLGDVRWEASVLAEVAQMHLDSGNHSEALRAAEGALLDLEEVEDTREQGLVRLRILVRVHAALWDFDAALLASTEAANIFHELEEWRAHGVAKFVVGSVQLWGSDFAEAQRSVTEAQQIFQELGETKLVVHALDLLSQVALAKKEPEEAARLAHDAHVLCQLEKDRFMEAAILLLVARAHFAILSKHARDWGDEGPPREFTSSLSKALKAATVAQRIAGKMQYSEVAASAASTLAQAKLVSGHFDEALGDADEAVRLYRELQDAAGEGHALAAKAQVLSAMSSTKEAKEALEASLALAYTCQDEELQALARELLQRLDGRAAAADAAAKLQQEAAAAPAAGAEPPEGAEASMASEAVQEQTKGLDPILVSDMLHGMIQQVIGEIVESDTPFMDAGVDSLMSIELRSQVNRAFAGLTLSSTMTFDFPTIRELVGHVVQASKE